MKEEPEPPENHERWLISYADFITLLMVFFVVLYSMSKVDAGKYEELSQSLNSALSGGAGILDGNPGDISPGNSGILKKPTPTPSESSGSEKDAAESQDMEKIEGQLKTYFDREGFSGSVSMNIDERGLVVSLNDTVLFDLGSSSIKPEARNELIQIGEALNAVDNYIRVEGHTDNLPISTGRYASNWELSAERATNVVRLLIDAAGVSPQKLSAVGYAEYKPVSDNSTSEGRAKNRRVDIILLSSRYNELEQQIR
ncbi:MAG: OmpA family protein [Clostridiales bacterium]|jgi:chemotaxis protein MotB|nr:OmpA family protein [Clostridiales bacterium]